MKEYQGELEAARQLIKEAEQTSTNNERDIICSDKVCDYCAYNFTEKICTNCFFDELQFKGRKLTPVL